MQKLCVLLVALSCTLGYSQNVIYHENFDPPSYRDSTFNSMINGIRAFDTTRQIAFSQPLSYHTKGYTISGMGSSPYFRTTSFSTIGQNFLVLSFKHIAKTNPFNHCHVSISRDNGNTWQSINLYAYQGSDPNWGGYFSSASYPEWQSNNDTAKPNSSWWKEETILINGLANDTTGPTTTGYSNVSVRFQTFFNVVPPSGFCAGWFIDDIKVTNYNCEMIPPSFRTTYYTNPCYRPYPSGYTIAQASNLYPMGVKVSDTGPFGSGVDSVRVHYQVKNTGQYGALQHMFLPKRSASPDEYFSYISNISAGDTVRYYISAVDGCSNTGYLPSQANGPAFNTFYVSDTLPTKCGTSLCGANVINTFPWREDFAGGGSWSDGSGNGNIGNSHRGSMPLQSYQGWGVFPSIIDSYGWSVRRGGTGTSETGPAYAPSQDTYDHYLYTEFSQGPALKNTKLTTPCINLTDSIGRIFTFDYHMYGADIEHLRIDIDTGQDSSAWVNGIGLISGQQQSSSFSPWKKYIIDLSPYIGHIVKLRFQSAGNLPGDKKDVAIDNLEIRNISPTDVFLIEESGDLAKFCGGTSNTPVNITLINGGSSLLTEVPVAYQLSNGAVIRDTIRNINLHLLDTVNFSFAQMLSFNGNTNHKLRIWSEMPLDTIQENDTLDILVPQKNNGLINSFPYIMDFESASMDTTTNTLSLGTTEWHTTHQQASRWVVESYSSNDYETGPSTQYVNEGKFLKVDKRSVWLDSVILRSGCIDLSTLTNPILSFEYYNMYSYQLEIFIRCDDGPWELLGQPFATPAYDHLVVEHIDLGRYAGKTVEVMFYQYVYSSLNMSLAIDNIVIGEKGTTDLTLLKVHNSIRKLTEGDSAFNNFDITYGKTMQSGNTSINTTLKAELKNICNPSGLIITGQSTFPVFSNNWYIDNQVFSSFSLSAPIPAGEYQLKLWLETSGDALTENDTLIMKLTVPKKLAVPYFNDFENCEVLFTDSVGLDQWEILTPPGGAYSGQKAAVLNEFRSLPGIHQWLPPTFKGLDTVWGAEVRFWHRHNFQANEYGRLEYYRPTQGWLPLFSATGVNSPLMFTDSAGWALSSYPLDHTQRANGELTMRFLSNVNTTAESGWAIDDFEIYVPKQVSAAPNDLLFLNGVPKAGTNDIAIKIYNSGRRSLDTAMVTILDNAGKQFIKELVSFSPPLPWQQERKIILQSKLLLDTTTSALTIITSQPNNRVDAIAKDDTLRYQLTLLKEIDSLPYCNDFEFSRDFLSFQTLTGSLDTIWQHTTPQKSVINTSHSGSLAWVTCRKGQYPPMVNRHLYTPYIAVKGERCYRLNFWHMYDTERNFDGGQIEYTLDSGQTWLLLGNYNDPDWYNTQYVQSLDGVKPGFSGRSNGWILSSQEFKVFGDSKIQFRFRFASNASISGEGWAIDDLCLEEITGSCQQIGLNELQLHKNAFQLYPNPVSQKIGFSISGEGAWTNAIGDVEIYDFRGQLVKKLKQSIQKGEQHFIDVSDLADGVYSISLHFNKDIFVRSFVKM